MISRRQSGFTLIELLLALALIVAATALIGSLMQMFAKNFETRGQDIRRVQLARAVLNMIAEDIRGIVIEQEIDQSVLEQQLGAASGGGDASAGGDTGTGLASDSAADTSLASGDDMLAEETTERPPGIYGDQYSLMVDVSRLPRPDEYMVQQSGMFQNTLNDVPGDIKTVTYYVQAPTQMGVEDTMSAFTQTATNASGYTGGLVRRAIDRGVAAYAEEMGNLDSLNRTGDIVAPEVVALQFAYFDGNEAQWVYEWDYQQQGLPWLVQVTIAMQGASESEQVTVDPGIQLNALSLADRQAMGIEIYELSVAIPGANLVASPTGEDAGSGMDAMGL